MDNLDFSEEEIEQQLVALGYSNIPKQRLREFKRDLDQLIRHERSKSQSSTGCTSQCDSKSSKSPPALIKEKVHLSNIGPSRNYVVFNSSSAGQRRDIFTSTFNEEDVGESDMNHYYDSYSRHSIAHRPARPSTAPNRLETEEGPSESFYSDTSQATVHDRENWPQSKPVIKRKVLRKHHGKSHVCDESTHSEDSGAVSKLEEHLECMQIGASHIHNESESEEAENYSDRSSSVTDEPPSAFDKYINVMTRSRSENDIRPRSKSFIRPAFDHPHTRNWKKTDPVAKYFQYKQEWEMFKPPGEKSRKELQWAIRERLLYQPPPPRPQKTYIPNTYVVPTEKKRSALRWEIRHDLAHGIIPTKMAYP